MTAASCIFSNFQLSASLPADAIASADSTILTHLCLALHSRQLHYFVRRLLGQLKVPEKMRNSLQVSHTILLSACFLFHFSEPISSTVITGSSSRFNQFSTFILESQQKIIKQLETEDGKATFCQDKWQKGESVSRLDHVILSTLDRLDSLTTVYDR